MATEATTETSALAAAKRKEFTRSIVELAGMLPVLIVICILFAVLTPNFLTQNNLVNVVRQASHIFGPSYYSSRLQSFYFEFPCPPDRGRFTIL